MGVHLAARLQRPRDPYRVDSWWKQGRPATGPAALRIVAWRRARGSRCTRRCGPRGRRPGDGFTPTSSPRSTRRSPTAWTSSTIRSAARRPTSSTRRGRIPVRRRRRRLRGRLGRQQRSDNRHGRTPGPMDHHRCSGHAQPHRAGLGDARRRLDVQRRVDRRPPWVRRPLD